MEMGFDCCGSELRIDRQYGEDWGAAQALVIILPSISSVTLLSYVFLFTPQFSTLQNGDKIVPTMAERLDFKMHVQVLGTAPGFHKLSVDIRYYHQNF